MQIITNILNLTDLNVNVSYKNRVEISALFNISDLV